MMAMSAPKVESTNGEIFFDIDKYFKEKLYF